MKFEENTRTIKTNVSEKSSFSIENNSAAFKILTSNLYKFPIRAIIRELSCNAIDANKEAGEKEHNWNLHMPSVEEPFFSIKDRGYGLSDSDVMNLYTTFFKSTKTDSNDVTGMFGLGSKTPFAYTNQFTIESTHKGTKNIYSAFFDSNGIPSITKVGSMDSNEHSGVKITFHVDTYDLDEFRNALRFCVGGWQFLPNISGVDEEELERLKYVARAYQGNYIDDDNAVVPGRYDSFTYIEMGRVLYNLSSYQLDSYIPEYIKALESVRGKDVGHMPHDLVFHVPIGTMSVTPSREELHYTDATKDALNSAITNKYFEEVYKHYQESSGSLRDLTEFFYFMKSHHGFCRGESYSSYSENPDLWGKILYERSVPYLTEENRRKYDEVMASYKVIYNEFQKLDMGKFKYVRATYKMSEWCYSFGEEKILKDDGDDYRKIEMFLGQPSERIQFVEMDSKVDKHFSPLRPVSIYLRNRLNFLLDQIDTAEGAYRKIDQNFLFITSQDFNPFKKYFPDHELFKGLDGILGPKKINEYFKREKGKVEVFIRNSQNSSISGWKHNVSVENLSSMAKSANVSDVFLIASRKISSGYYKYYLNSAKDIINKTAVLSNKFADFQDIFRDSSIGQIDNYMVITSTPSKLAQIKDFGIKWQDPIEYVLKEFRDSFQKNVDENKIISSGFFREMNQENRDYFLSYDWGDTNDLYKIAKDTFSIDRKGCLAKMSIPRWFNNIESVLPPYGKYLGKIQKLSAEFDDTRQKKHKFLMDTRNNLISDCPLMRLMSLSDDLFVENRHYFYGIGGDEIDNTKMFFDYMAECYGVKKKEV